MPNNSVGVCLEMAFRLNTASVSVPLKGQVVMLNLKEN